MGGFCETPSVLVVLAGSLITLAVTSLLVADADLRLIISEADDFDSLQKEIHCVEPDVILMEESIPLMTNNSIIELMTTFSNLRVIVVSENNNWLHVFRKDTQLITTSADLIQAIHTF